MPTLSCLRWTGLALLGSLAAPRELKLKESDHKALSKVVGVYFTARDEEKGINEAMVKAMEQVATTEKRLKGSSLLGAVADWEEVFRLVTAERLQETLRKRGTVAEHRFKGPNGLEIPVAYCTPKKVGKAALPLVLIACDAGESPSGHLDAHWNDPVLREAVVLVAMDLGKNTASWGVFGSQEEPGGAWITMAALGLVRREFPVDVNRTFLVGSGRGLEAALAAGSSYPQSFAGLIGLGDHTPADLSTLENFRTIPSLLLGPGAGAKAIEAKLTELGFANCKVDPEGKTAAACDWIQKTARSAYPARIAFSPKSDYAKRVHWLSMSGFQTSEGPHVEATIDRATNSISIEAQKIAELVVYLNDSLVDLDKPVRLVVNGVSHEQTVDRNVPEMIRGQYETGDWGRVFTAYVIQDVPR